MMIRRSTRLGTSLILFLGFATLSAIAGGPVAVVQMESGHKIPSNQPGLSIFLHHAAPRSLRAGALPVLILHGATFPTDLAAGWRMNGKSWMDEWTDRGYEVWGLDFLGYGRSDRYPDMAKPPQEGKILGDLDDLVDQVALAVDHIQAESQVRGVFLVAHSAGTFVAGRYAERHPGQVARLVLFGAPVPKDSVGPKQAASDRASSPSAWFPMTVQAQFDSFESKVKASGRLDTKMFKAWGEAYVDSDPYRDPHGVHVPSGMQAVYLEMTRSGKLPYVPRHIHCPTLLIAGEWDEVAPASQALRLYHDLGTPLKRHIVIGQGGHRMHLEASRRQLYREVEAFIAGEDE